MNKKASMDTIFNFLRLIIVIIVFFSIVSFARGSLREKIDIFESESILLIQRLMFSREINYVDSETGREYVGIIDLKKLQSDELKQRLLNSVYYGRINSETSAKLVLEDIETGKAYYSYYNEELYKEKKVLVEAKLIGMGAASSFATKFYVLIKDDNNLRKGVLTIDAVLPNR